MISIKYTTVQLAGEDRLAFLQGQLTCDIAALKPGEDCLGAHCNPKGRVMSLFRVYARDEAIVLRIPSPMAEVALANLKKFIFRSKVTIEIIDAPNDIPVTENLADLIAQGLPEVLPETTEHFLPHDINLPDLGGVSFQKGCYIGQEIVARMHYLGKPKQAMHKVSIATPEDIAPYAEIKNDADKVVGHVVLSAKQQDRTDLLAVIKTSALADALTLASKSLVMQ